MDQAERNKKVEENLRLVSHSLSLLKVPWNEDYFQQGVLELIRCVERYDESKGYKFSTYAVKCITLKLKDYIKRDYVIKPKLTGEKGGKVWAPQCISLSKPVVSIPGNKEISMEDMLPVEDNMNDLYVRCELERMVQDEIISKIDLQMFMDFELNGYTLKEIRERYNLTNKEIRTKIKELKETLREEFQYNYYEGGK